MNPERDDFAGNEPFERYTFSKSKNKWMEFILTKNMFSFLYKNKKAFVRHGESNRNRLCRKYQRGELSKNRIFVNISSEVYVRNNCNKMVHRKFLE